MHIVFVRREDTTTNKGLKWLSVKLFTCEWHGTAGSVGRFSLSAPETWSLDQGQLPLVVIVPGTDDRRVFSGGAKSALNPAAQAIFQQALVVECNPALAVGKNSWSWGPQPWMGDLTMFLKALCCTFCSGIGYSRGTSWLLQLASCSHMFDKLVLLAPYPPPNMNETICAERIKSFMDLENIMVIGTPMDEHACTQEAHPEFWDSLIRAGMNPWTIAPGDHKATNRKSY